MSAFSEELEAAVRRVLREEMPKLLREDPERKVRVMEASKRTGLAKATLYEMAEELKIPSYKVGRALLFKVADLDEYIERTRRSRDAVVRLAGAK